VSRPRGSCDWFIDHLDPLGGIHCLGERLRDDDGDRFPDIAHGIAGENRVRCDEKLGAVAAAERYFVWICRHRAVRDRSQAVRRRVATGQHCDDPGSADRLCHIHLRDLRVRMWRTHQVRVGLAWQAEIVCVLPCAGDQPCFLAARH
jgi:hypothetical protein